MLLNELSSDCETSGYISRLRVESLFHGGERNVNVLARREKGIAAREMNTAVVLVPEKRQLQFSISERRGEIKGEKRMSGSP